MFDLEGLPPPIFCMENIFFNNLALHCNRPGSAKGFRTRFGTEILRCAVCDVLCVLCCCIQGNDTVYTTVGRPLVARSMDGQVGVVFAYGQTGSGKTHTMNGIMDGAAEQIFEQNDQRAISFSYFEVYVTPPTLFILLATKLLQTITAVHHNRPSYSNQATSVCVLYTGLGVPLQTASQTRVPTSRLARLLTGGY